MITEPQVPNAYLYYEALEAKLRTWATWSAARDNALKDSELLIDKVMQTLHDMKDRDL